jgi:hypothetical protein
LSSDNGRPGFRLISFAVAFSPINFGSTSDAGFAFLNMARVHSGFSSSARSAASSNFLLIKPHIFPVRSPQADYPQVFVSGCHHGNVETVSEVSENQETQFTVIVPVILNDQCSRPIEIIDQIKGKSTLCNIASVLLRIKPNHHI